MLKCRKIKKYILKIKKILKYALKTFDFDL